MKKNKNAPVLCAILLLTLWLSACQTPPARDAETIGISAPRRPDTEIFLSRPPSSEGAEPDDSSHKTVPDQETSVSERSAVVRDFLPDLESRLAAMINARRDINGLSPLCVDAGLTGAARLRALELARGEDLSHRRPDGREWFTVLEDEFPLPCTDKGENIAQLDGEEGLAAQAADWYRQFELSPSQKDNMFFPEFDQMGVGMYYEENGANYRVIAVALFVQGKKSA